MKTEFKLIEVHGQKLLTTSLVIAEQFEKRHDRIIRKIESGFNSENKEISAFTRLNFGVSEYLDSSGKRNKYYKMTEEGFAEIAMSLTGEKAKLIRIKFLSEFKLMQKELSRIREQRLTVDWQEARANSKCIRSTLSQVVQAYERLADKQGGEKIDKHGKNVGRHYYDTITKMIYKQLFGDGALKNIRDKLDALQLQFLTICESSCAHEIQRLVDIELEYHAIYHECKKRVIATVDGLSASKLTSTGKAIRLAWEKPIEETK